uniref:Mediator of RNA polymerase II transcription subunit 21 n=1 Tax=Oryza meridionalis TaxID=40149 RepID=A0A0E0EHL9_9ORYZ
MGLDVIGPWWIERRRREKERERRRRRSPAARRGRRSPEMDIISQLQEQLNEMAMVAVNTFGTLQRDAPPVRLSNNYPDPLNPAAAAAANPNPDDPAQPQPGAAAAAAPGAPAAQAQAPPAQAQPPALDLAEHPKAMSHALVLAAKKFDALVSALPLSSEEDQLKRIKELQAENEVVGSELQKQLEAAELELKQVEALFNEATDHCINLKKPE